MFNKQFCQLPVPQLVLIGSSPLELSELWNPDLAKENRNFDRKLDFPLLNCPVGIGWCEGACFYPVNMRVAMWMKSFAWEGILTLGIVVALLSLARICGDILLSGLRLVDCSALFKHSKVTGWQTTDGRVVQICWRLCKWVSLYSAFPHRLTLVV